MRSTRAPGSCRWLSGARAALTAGLLTVSACSLDGYLFNERPLDR